MKQRVPQTVACTTCGAAIGGWCKSKTGYNTEYHKARLDLVKNLTDDEADAALLELAATMARRRQAVHTATAQRRAALRTP